jgi:Fe2+ or Zn2+ uptake regulation protein
VEARIFESLEKTLRDQYGFVANLDHFAIFGLCRKCQAAEKKTVR